MTKIRARIVSFTMAMVMAVGLLAGCGGTGNQQTSANDSKKLGDLKYVDSIELKYAKNFTIDNYEGGYTYIKSANNDRILVVPEGASEPKNLSKGVVVIKAPVNRIYLAASAAMALFNACGAIDNVLLSGISEGNWYIDDANKNMSEGKLFFAGKYNAPDYELLLNKECQLAIESTMINHVPDVREKLEELGIPVFMDQASGEEHPLGRMEWVKAYGALTGHLKEAVEFFDKHANEVEAVAKKESTGKTVAFFSINSAGLAVVRKTKDYVPYMIQLAGGKYIFDKLGEDSNAFSTESMSLEEFYNTARDADIIIYNSSIEGEIKTVNELISKSNILKDMKAVKEGNVWCAAKDMYQATDAIADIILDMRSVFTNDAEGLKTLKYIYKLQ